MKWSDKTGYLTINNELYNHQSIKVYKGEYRIISNGPLFRLQQRIGKHWEVIKYEKPRYHEYGSLWGPERIVLERIDRDEIEKIKIALENKQAEIYNSWGVVETS